MENYRLAFRGMIGEYLSSDKTYDGHGIYVIACYPVLGCVYVGISEDVRKRLHQHLECDDQIGTFVRNVMSQSIRWRLDVLVPGNEVADANEWLIYYERKLIQQFRPFCNTSGLGEGNEPLYKYEQRSYHKDNIGVVQEGDKRNRRGSCNSHNTPLFAFMDA